MLSTSSVPYSNILLKLDELKRWQEKQQEHILEQHHKRIQENVVELPVIEMSTPKPRRPFLRKGAGLSRYRMTSGEQFKPFNKNKHKTSYRPKQIDPIKPKAVWNDCSSDTNVGLDTTDKELIVFEALEQRTMQNSFCSTNSSIVRLLSNDTPKKQVAEEATDDLQEINALEQKLHGEYLTLIKKAVQFKQYVSDNKPPSSSVSSADEETTLQVSDNFNDKINWSDEDSIVSSIDNEQRKCDVETMTESLTTNNNQADDEFRELEKMKRQINVEEMKVKKVRSQLEQQQREFEKHKKEILKAVEEEKTRINSVLEEERKKLNKERLVFERYVKDLQNKPSKKERELISALKIEVATLKETLKLKETKNGTTQARLRNQIKSLETETSLLKLEIEKLNKQNAKLVVNQKLNRRPSDTKMLHEINKTLTKLTQEKKSASLDETDVLLKIDNTTPIKLDEKENDKNTSNNVSVSGRTEIILGDGSKQIKYSNGNIKTITPDGNTIVFQYYNGDIKETNLLEGVIRYHYYETKVNHTTNIDGTEIMEFPNGQIEKRFKNGITEIHYVNGIIRRTSPDKLEEIIYPDGTKVLINVTGERTLLLPNGQKEIHTDDYKKRIYPDGTVKILYPDGLQETRYANGRIRLKDKQGNLIMDSSN